MPTPLLYEKRPVGTAFNNALASVPTLGDSALIRVSGGNIRWTDTGATPNASIGILCATSDPPLFYEGPVASILFANVGAVASGTASLDVIYYEGRFRL